MARQKESLPKQTVMEKSLSDEKLFQLCRKYGEQTRYWRQKFAGLLPEVNKRRLYEKKGFHSIFEFAKKLAGFSEEQVRRVLNLERNFQDKPVLKSILENGEVSVNKLAKIASIATKENQNFLADQAQLLPCHALETLVRDMKTITGDSQKFENENGSQKTLFEDKSVHVNRFLKEKRVKILEVLSSELEEKLYQLSEKGIDINCLLLELLEKYELEIIQEKEKISAEIQKEQQPKNRYISVKIKKLIQKEQGTKCSIPTCTKPAKIIHHTQRFSLVQNHDPHYLAKMCEDHHKIAHSIDVQYHQVRSNVLAI